MFVNPGFYPEILTVNKNITISGSSQIASDVVVNPGAGNDGVTISAGNVTWQHVTFTGGCNGVVASGVATILTLNNVTSTLNTCDGVHVSAASSLTINDSTMTGNGDDGIDLDNVSGGSLITNVTATGNTGEGLDTNSTGDLTINAGTFNGILTRAANRVTLNGTSPGFGAVTSAALIDIESNNAIDVNSPVNAGSNTIRLAANLDATGADGFTMGVYGVLNTTSDSATAVQISVNTLVGGTGSATIAKINAGTTGGHVTISSMGGSIGGASTLGDNVTAAGVLLTASGSVGSAANRIKTSVSNLEGSGMTGFFVTNTGNLVIGGVSGSSTGVMSSGGTVDVRTNSPLTVSENVTGNAVFLKANDKAGFGDDLTVSAAVTVQATAGNVDLEAGDDVTLQAGSTIIASGAIHVVIDCGNADPGVGATATISGLLNSGTGISISGQHDSDHYNITYPTGSTFGGAITIVDLGGALDSVTVNATNNSESLFITPTATTTTVGRGGAATESITLPASSEALRVNALDGNDVVNMAPSTNTTITVDGGSPGFTGGTVPPGDILNFNAGGNQVSIQGTSLVTSGSPAFKNVTFQNFESVPITSPSPTGALRFDLNQARAGGPASTPTQAGYTGVLNTTKFSDGLGYGWDDQGGIQGNDLNSYTSTLSDLIRDSHSFGLGSGAQTRTFSANVANGDVLVNVVFGSQFSDLRGIQIRNRDTDAILVSELDSLALSSDHVNFVTSVTDGTLDCRQFQSGVSSAEFARHDFDIAGHRPQHRRRSRYRRRSSADQWSRSSHDPAATTERQRHGGRFSGRSQRRGDWCCRDRLQFVADSQIRFQQQSIADLRCRFGGEHRRLCRRDHVELVRRGQRVRLDVSAE